MSGLTSEEVKQRQKKFGLNQLPAPVGESVLSMFLRQFQSPFIYMLLAAAVVSFSLGQTVNGMFIFIVLVINATIGTVQEFSAQKAAEALKKMVPQHANVIRNGISVTINSEHIVPDDVVLLASGDKVPADILLSDCQGLLVDESILTGESIASAKHCAKTYGPGTSVSERSDCVFAGTIVTHGRGQGCVTATGAATRIGAIAEGVADAGSIKPPLLQRIERFTLRVSYAVLLIIALLFVLALARNADLGSVFLLGVALAVSAIPEGLPAAITVALAIGMRRMAKVNVIVRKLVAVESLGSCTFIASDKTGTLTVNEMTIKKIVLSDGVGIDVSGEGLDIHGELDSAHTANAHTSEIEKLVRAGALANESSLVCRNGEWIPRGDGVDLAFLVLAEKFGFDQQQVGVIYPRLERIPYESERAFSASVNRVNGESHLSVKGSVEQIVDMCNFGQCHRHVNQEQIISQTEALAEKGYRVIALAEKPLLPTYIDPHAQLNDLTFLGLVGMVDPLRPEARGAVNQCREAQIAVAMVTGDHPKTAQALAEELGIAMAGEQAVTGKQIEAAEAAGVEALRALVCHNRVFARVAPEQKTKIVEQLIQAGHYVAVTGDGVNDAPALHHAHVGIAMGKRGSDVARESAELIIADDNFASIVEGIKQGRIVYNNIRKVVFLLISTGAAEITLFILSVLFALPIPLFPIQLLWLNLVTNGIQDVALAFEPEEGDELKKPPRAPREKIFNRLMLERVVINALVMGCLAFGVFWWCINSGLRESEARNTTLLLMVLFENVHVLNSRSETRSIFKQAFLGNPLLIFGMFAAQGLHITAMYTPGLNSVLQIEPVSFEQWLSLLTIALCLVLVDEGHKWWLASKQN